MTKMRYRHHTYRLRSINNRGAYMTAVLSRFGKQIEVPLEQLRGK